MSLTVAIVTPWYGPAIPGGMEAETRRLAAHLTADGQPVEILTTCIRDFYADWSANFHRPGRTLVDGVPVRRFAVGPRDKATFDHINHRLMRGLPITSEQETVYLRELLNCPELFRFMAQRQREYLFLFIPYLAGTTVWGASIAPQRSAVIPCLHDESYARLAVFRRILPRLHTMILHTPAELALAERLLGPAGAQRRLVVGEGVDVEMTADADRFRARFGLHGPLVLSVGRREPGKNTPLLLDYWRRYVAETQTPAHLVLIGPGDVDALPPQTVDLGFLPTQDKRNAHAAAAVFCQPSRYESFSIVLMDSWLAGAPALVHADCAVTREHCTRSNGGLYFADYDEFAAALTWLLDHPDAARRMGQLGRRYVLDNYTWETVIGRYRAIFAAMTADLPTPAR